MTDSVWLSALGPSALVVIGGLVSWFIKSRVEDLRAVEEKLRADRRKIYMEVLDPYIRLFADPTATHVQAQVIKKITSYEYKTDPTANFLTLLSFARDILQALPETRPPRFVDLRHVVVPLAEPDSAIDELPDDVGMTRMSMRFGDHVQQDLVQRHLRPVFRPPGNPADRIQRQCDDRLVRMCPDAPVEPHDLVARLIGRSPHIRIRLSVVGVPRHRLFKWATEALTEVACLDACDMFDESQQIGARRSERSTLVVLGQSVEFPEERFPSDLQVTAQMRFGIGCSHLSRMARGGVAKQLRRPLLSHGGHSSKKLASQRLYSGRPARVQTATQRRAPHGRVGTCPTRQFSPMPR
jgi:hypothetical protein